MDRLSDKGSMYYWSEEFSMDFSLVDTKGNLTEWRFKGAKGI